MACPSEIGSPLQASCGNAFAGAIVATPISAEAKRSRYREGAFIEKSFSFV